MLSISDILNSYPPDIAARKREFIKYAQTFFPAADTTILLYIDDFVNHSNKESTINLFSNGYCYAFAQILQQTFGCGEICWVAPYSHIVWLKNKVPYDINGIYDGASELFIPESFLKEHIIGFKHIPNYVDNTTKKDIQNIITAYQKSL